MENKMNAIFKAVLVGLFCVAMGHAATKNDQAAPNGFKIPTSQNGVADTGGEFGAWRSTTVYNREGAVFVTSAPVAIKGVYVSSGAINDGGFAVAYDSNTALGFNSPVQQGRIGPLVYNSSRTVSGMAGKWEPDGSAFSANGMVIYSGAVNLDVTVIYRELNK